MRLICSCLIAILAVPATGQDRPLPDYATFMAEVRKRLEADDVRQSDYVYVATQREQKLDAAGTSTKETLNVFESYPALPNESRWRRQTVKDGRPVSPEDLAEADRDRQKKVLEYAKKLEQNPEKVRDAERKKHEEERRDSERAVDDALRVYDIRMLGREVVSGYETIAFSFVPKKDAKPQTSEGKIMCHFAGKAWVSESEYEVVRIEAEAIDTVSFGLGLLARVHQGSKAMRVGGTLEFSDYRKFTVHTDTKIGKEP